MWSVFLAINCVLSRSDQGQCTTVTFSRKCMATGYVSGAPIHSKTIDRSRATIIKSKKYIAFSFCLLSSKWSWCVCYKKQSCFLQYYAIKNSLVFFPAPCPEVALDSWKIHHSTQLTNKRSLRQELPWRVTEACFLRILHTATTCTGNATSTDEAICISIHTTVRKTLVAVTSNCMQIEKEKVLLIQLSEKFLAGSSSQLGASGYIKTEKRPYNLLSVFMHLLLVMPSATSVWIWSTF